MKLFDTAQKKVVDFKPPKTVRIYTCGITPYDSAHLGHIFTFMTYDILQRYLEDQGHEVQLVRNITDVDEPIFKRAGELGISYQQLAEQETTDFQKVLKKLHFRPAYAEPLASEYIDDMAIAVSKLLDNGFAYRLDEDIYYDVSRDPSFGSFSGYNERLQLAFMRRRGGDPGRDSKRNKLDFLLWRGISDANDPAAWESPVGRGRPGWHIECSIMSDKLLSIPFDLHGGGSDLIYPHHECEIAQSHGLGQNKVADCWMHVAPISYLGEKMSKSLGNLVFASDLLQKYEPAAIRLALMNYHYMEGGEWLPTLLDDATELLNQVNAVRGDVSYGAADKLLQTVRLAIEDNLDTHAIGHALIDFAKNCKSSSDKSGGEPLLNNTLQILGLE
jgi:L-cysteine:1D-myo-inositol 2-amino-2-deoxy-alpha-D-glucopyranoside ligase